jgi:hypothetical protein
MGVPTLEFGYTSVTTGMGDNEVHKGPVVALGEPLCCPTKCGFLGTEATESFTGNLKQRIREMKSEIWVEFSLFKVIRCLSC